MAVMVSGGYIEAGRGHPWSAWNLFSLFPRCRNRVNTARGKVGDTQVYLGSHALASLVTLTLVTLSLVSLTLTLTLTHCHLSHCHLSHTVTLTLQPNVSQCWAPAILLMLQIKFIGINTGPVGSKHHKNSQIILLLLLLVSLHGENIIIFILDVSQWVLALVLVSQWVLAIHLWICPMSVVDCQNNPITGIYSCRSDQDFTIFKEQIYHLGLYCILGGPKNKV